MNTALVLLRREANVFLNMRGIPAQTLLNYFPRLEEIAKKTLFGTDWPGPGVPEIKKNLDEFRALNLAEAAKQQILSRTAMEIWPVRETLFSAEQVSELFSLGLEILLSMGAGGNLA